MSAAAQEFVRVILRETPTAPSRQLALRILEKLGASRPEALNRLEEMPCIISQRINRDTAERLAALLRERGAVVDLEAVQVPTWVAQTTSPTPRAAPSAHAANPAPRPDASSNYVIDQDDDEPEGPGLLRRIFRWGLVGAAALCLALFVVWKTAPELLRDYLPVPVPLAPTARATPKPTPNPFTQPPRQTVSAVEYMPGGLRPLRWRQMSFQDIAFVDQPQYWKDALLLDPDRRLANVFSCLLDLYHVWPPSRTDGAGPDGLTAGIRYDATRIRASLQRDGAELDAVELPYDADFADWLQAYEQWITLLEKHAGPLPSYSVSPQEALAMADDLLNQGEPRALFLGLAVLNGLGVEHGPHPALLRRAVRGYALMLMGLPDDPLARMEPLATRGVAFLAMARHAAPDNAPGGLVRDEGLLALAMGYASHAQMQGALLASQDIAPRDDADQLMDLALNADCAGLADAALDETRAAKSTLAPILYMDLLAQAGEHGRIGGYVNAGRAFLPLALPVLAALADDASLAERLNLTFFTLEYINHVVGRPNEPGGWLETDADVDEDEFPDMRRFAARLTLWDPLTGGGDGPFATAAECRNVMQSYYESILYNFHHTHTFSRGVPEEGREILEDFATAMDDHPLVIAMDARTLQSAGRHKDAEATISPLFKSPECTPFLVEGNEFLIFPAQETASRPWLAQILDSRPSGLAEWAEQIDEQSKTRAVSALRRAIRLNPAYGDRAVFLAELEGDEAVLRASLNGMNTKAVTAGRLLRKAGDFYAEHGGKGLDHALACYRQAISLNPGDKILMRNTLRVMKKLEMWDEAEKLYLDQMGEQMSKNTVGAYNTRCTLGVLYIEHDQPEKALQLVGHNVDSAIGAVMATTAQALARMGENERSDEIFRALHERYPTASFYYAYNLESLILADRIDKAAEFAQTRAEDNTHVPRRWVSDTMVELTKHMPYDQAVQRIGAFSKAVNRGKGLPWWFAQDAIEKLLAANRPEAALAYMEHASFANAGPTGKILRYMVLAAHPGYGEEDALRDLRSSTRGKMYLGVATGLMERQYYRPVMVDDLLTYDTRPKFHAYMLLLQTIGWLANDRAPQGYDTTILSRLDRVPQDIYAKTVRFLLGKAPAAPLLEYATNDHNRGEVAYYLGLASRVQGDFETAAAWYTIGTLYDQESNMEHRFMEGELAQWEDLGLKQRQPAAETERRLLQDIRQGKAYDPAPLPFEQARTAATS